MSAALPFAGAAVGAAGNVAGGLIGASGGVSSGDLINANFNPNLDLALQASNFDLLSQIGFGNINNVPDPLQQLVGKINALPIEERIKRRAINFLPRAMKFQEAGADNPFDFNRGREVRTALRRLGIDQQGLAELVNQRNQQQEQVQRLRDAGLGGMQTDVILNRANAARTASELMGGAADFARTGQAGNPLSQDLFARDERQLADLRDKLGVLANFGGINPASMFDSLSDAKLDQTLRLIEQQLGMSSAIQNALGAGSQAGSQAAAQQSGSSTNAAQIAAQQAMAANQLRMQSEQDKVGSLASGISSAAGGLGSAISNQGFLSQLLANQPQSQQFSSGLMGGGLGQQGMANIASRFAVPGVFSGGGGF